MVWPSPKKFRRLMPNEKRGLKPVTPAGRIERCGAAADASDFGAHADVHGIASGLLERVEDVLVGLVAVRVLDGGVDARENAEIVQPALAAVDLALRERVARAQADAVRHHVGLRALQASHQNVAHVHPLAGRHDKRRDSRDWRRPRART